jgi:hypothetical protein
MNQQFQIVPASSTTLMVLIVIGALVFFTLVPFAWVSYSSFVIIAIGTVVLFILVLLGWVGYSSRNAKFTVSSSGLKIIADMYSRSIPLADIQKEGAAVINLEQQDGYRPVLRTNGVGLPGYGSGWFTLKNGDKALAYITSRKAVTYIPTNKGYCLLLSVSHPQEFIDALRKAS